MGPMTNASADYPGTGIPTYIISSLVALAIAFSSMVLAFHTRGQAVAPGESVTGPAGVAVLAPAGMFTPDAPLDGSQVTYLYPSVHNGWVTGETPAGAR